MARRRAIYGRVNQEERKYLSMTRFGLVGELEGLHLMLVDIRKGEAAALFRDDRAEQLVERIFSVVICLSTDELRRDEEHTMPCQIRLSRLYSRIGQRAS